MASSASLDLSRYQAILFDFDGTLAPCLDLRAMKQTVLEFTLRESGIERAEIDSMMVVEFIEFTGEWLENRDRDGPGYRAQAHQLVKDIEMAAAAHIRLYDGARQLMSTLARRSIGIGIVTRNCEMAVRQMFPDVDAYCQALFTRDHVLREHLKPDPRHLLACIKQLGCKTTQSLMVGDGILDMRVAAGLDMDRIGVLGGHNSREDLSSAGATWIVPNVRDLLACV